MSLIVDAPISNEGVVCCEGTEVFATVCWFDRDVTWFDKEVTWVVSLTFLAMRSCRDVTRVAFVCMIWFNTSCCWANMVLRTVTDDDSDRQGRHTHQVVLLSTSSTHCSWCQWKHKQHLIMSPVSVRFNLHCTWHSWVLSLSTASVVAEPSSSSAAPAGGDAVLSADDVMLDDEGSAGPCSATAAADASASERENERSFRICCSLALQLSHIVIFSDCISASEDAQFPHLLMTVIKS